MGHPRLDIDLDDMEFLSSLKLSLKKVSLLLGVSRLTIYRQMMEGRVIGGYSRISDAELDSLIERVKVDHPHDGEVMIAGHLTHIGVRITRARLRHLSTESIQMASQREAVRQLSVGLYSVPHANYIWHIDSHQKLIRCHSWWVLHEKIVFEVC